MAIVSYLFEILQMPTIWDVWINLIIFIVPLWISVILGVLVGWAWKPSWVNMGKQVLDLFALKSSSSSLSALDLIPSLNSLKSQLPRCFFWIGNDGVKQERFSNCSPLQLETEKSVQVNEDDFLNLWKLVEVKDGGPDWVNMMIRSSPNMTYQAWRRDLKTGPPQYRTRSVFEDIKPELVREFFWDDGFRSKWDDMLIHSSTLEECYTTGTMLVHWIRKFPFFCSDREYVIGRRIWEMDGAYYCVTKGVPSTSVPRRNKPRRVDLYYSSWRIRAVESKKGRGEACEVLLFHYEDMGLPWEIAKLGVRQGMWGAVKKIDPALRKYTIERQCGVPILPCVLMARVNTKVNSYSVRSLGRCDDDCFVDEMLECTEKPSRWNIPKILVVGGAVVVACSLDRGLLTKAIMFGVGRRLAGIGRRL